MRTLVLHIQPVSGREDSYKSHLVAEASTREASGDRIISITRKSSYGDASLYVSLDEVDNLIETLQEQKRKLTNAQTLDRLSEEEFNSRKIGDSPTSAGIPGRIDWGR